tara:strand:- start:1021 stop:1311 length:291 start_codon:yes stop_codon:yes gene_type:complete
MWKAVIISILVLMLIPMIFWVNNAEPNETPAQYTAKVVRTSFSRGFDDFEHLNYKKEEEATRGGENIKPEPVKIHPLIPPVTEDITTNFLTVTEDE